MTFRLSILLCCAVMTLPLSADPIKLHPKNPRYFEFNNRPAVLVTSGEHYGAVLNAAFDFVPYLDELASKKLNLTRTFSGTYREIPESFGITDNVLAPKSGKYLAPWARSDQPGESDGGNKFDLTKLDESYFKRAKDFVREAGKRGVVVEYVLFCPFYDDKLFAANPMNAKNNVNGVGTMPANEVYTLKHPEMVRTHEAFVRRVVAELNEFDNLYFEICNEPYFGGVTLDWQAHIAKVIVETEKNLPKKHLIAQNIANDKKKVEKPDPNVSVFNFHYATPPDTVAMNYALNKVIGDDETGFKGKDDFTYRSEGWDFLIAGGAVYSSLDYSFTVDHPKGTLREYKSPGGGSPELRQQLGILKEFMESFDFINMKPMNDVMKGGTITATLNPGSRDGARATNAQVSVRTLAIHGQQYAAYVRGGTKASLMVNLPPGKYLAQWHNTRTGKVEAKADLEGGGERTLESPAYDQDIALSIRVIR